ncbi:hypothetical protein BCR34DRAFT_599918 [Clohesyomyces aquaticus]|uniref:EthD domain-containing protein n=1 Tax=Clohesyomyces aquaticus TaxID=1231657 RepID=A0A1Y1ZT12_9PLEO|nr:hypothetical protein BCR34DRAFT_599918 [Clohesyomyces aquaticus]
MSSIVKSFTNPKPGFTLTVLYRLSESQTFDLDYYLSHHIPMTIGKWGPRGLINGYVTKTTGNSEFGYYFTATWKNEASWAKAQAAYEEMAEIMGDVKNVTSAEPIFVVGNVVGAW